MGALVWLDNRTGFRDAEAIATLLAAIFSMIATIWLIVTVWFQRMEIELQREELALQRAESRRIADETGRQAKLMTEQLTITLKQSMVSQVSSYFLTRMGKMCQAANGLMAAARSRAVERAGVDPAAKWTIVIGSESLMFTLKSGDGGSVEVCYDELLDVIPNSLNLRTLCKWHRRALDVDLEEWFRTELPYSVGNLQEGAHRITTARIRLLLNVAARMEIEG